MLGLLANLTLALSLECNAGLLFSFWEHEHYLGENPPDEFTAVEKDIRDQIMDIPPTTLTIRRDIAIRPTTDLPFDNSFAALVQGHLLVPASGDYTLYLSSDDGAVLYLNGDVVIDNDGPRDLAEVAANVSLSAGYHRLELVYYQIFDSRELELSWSSGDLRIARTPIPPAAFVHLLPSDEGSSAPISFRRVRDCYKERAWRGCVDDGRVPPREAHAIGMAHRLAPASVAHHVTRQRERFLPSAHPSIRHVRSDLACLRCEHDCVPAFTSSMAVVP